jgi:pyruvate dehydrogenase E2 component (dihydrolipoamide acetyltransferase)
MYGLDLFQAIINPPQGAILAVGSVRERAVVENGTVVARPTFFMTLSVDHRVTDGAHAALFLKDLKEMLESPYPALLPD